MTSIRPTPPKVAPFLAVSRMLTLILAFVVPIVPSLHQKSAEEKAAYIYIRAGVEFMGVRTFELPTPCVNSRWLRGKTSDGIALK